ncbi:hypothetical protein HRI_001675200 [Hibiscus trionum]|uniref:DUF7086 domain-containing protein n=1 Tax=Hibiscus trionum TaxID=183268 RepID=A0A9W7LWU8_HIBTR|nr:hypothetical protein HRI_001675200 [Hibiscus trionum]
MDNKSSQIYQDDENLLTLTLWTGPRSPPLSPTSSPKLTSTTLPLETQIISLPPPPDSIFQQVVPNLEASSLPIIPFLPPPPPIPQDLIFQPVVPNQQVPSFSIYPNHESHTPTGLDLNDNAVPQEIVSHPRPPRPRRNTAQTLKQDESKTIPRPFPWATTQHATVHSLDYLLSHNITTISGEVQCKRCDKVYTIKYDLLQKFREVSDFIKEHKFALHDRAPPVWMNPNLPGCESCGSCVRPVVVEDKSSINWLFLLLGQMLGCCKLSELQYFCEHTKNHKTGAKDRVLYLTYLGLCKQLDPTGPFDI